MYQYIYITVLLSTIYTICVILIYMYILFLHKIVKNYWE